MNFLQALVLGFVQGLTELLPISSSGHLILVPHIFKWPDQGLAFDAVMHLATGLVILFVLRSEIKAIFLRLFSFKSHQPVFGRSLRQAWLIVAAAVLPAGIIGWFFGDMIESTLRQVEVVAISLIVWGIVLGLADYYHRRFKQIFKLEEITPARALYVGLAQILAFIPGTSRSGITITAGLFSRFDRPTAVKFSFLAGLPLVLAAGFYKLFTLWQAGFPGVEWNFLLTGFLSAMFSGWLAIRWLLWLARRSDFKFFAIYRVILGLLLLYLF